MISDYINVDLIKKLGIDKMSDAKRAEYIEKFNDIIASRINNAVMTRLSDEDIKELERRMGQGDAVDAFLQDRIPQFDVMVKEIVANFKANMIAFKESMETDMAELSEPQNI